MSNRTKEVPKAKRGRPSKFPGICSDAKSLGVTRGYLWNILTGRMKSARLSQKYKILKGSQAGARQVMQDGHDAGWRDFYAREKPALLQKLSADFAALQNHSTELQTILEKLGIQIVAVQFSGDQTSPLWNQPDVGEPLSSDIAQSGAGSFDSASMVGGSWWCFYHVTNLARGLRAIKKALEDRNLLEHARIFHIESEAGWRIYWPAIGKLIIPSE